jgi:hypothetical protein
MRNVVVALLSIVGSVTIASVGNAQSGQDNPSRTKNPAARISQSHQELAISAKKDTRKAGTNESHVNDSDHIITYEEHKAVPYRACIDARGWRNGRLVCANDSETTLDGREVEGPYSE